MKLAGSLADTLVVPGAFFWDFMVEFFILLSKRSYSIKTNCRIDPRIVNTPPNSVMNVLWVVSITNGGDRVVAMGNKVSKNKYFFRVQKKV